MGLGLHTVSEEGQERGEGEAGDRAVTAEKFLSSLTSLGEANCCCPIILTLSRSLAHKGLLQFWQSGPKKAHLFHHISVPLGVSYSRVLHLCYRPHYAHPAEYLLRRIISWKPARIQRYSY